MIKPYSTALSFALTMSWYAFPAAAQYSRSYAQETDRTDRESVEHRQRLQEELDRKREEAARAAELQKRKEDALDELQRQMKK
jgi:hypothetical protein